MRLNFKIGAIVKFELYGFGEPVYKVGKVTNVTPGEVTILPQLKVYRKNENSSSSDPIYQDSFGNVQFLGFAHSHPGETDFRFSTNDTKNHEDFVDRFSDFISIILNPQKQKIVCFSGKDCVQAKLMLLYK